MTEPDVALTDYGLAIESAAFAYLIARQKPANVLRPWFLLFFASLTVSSLAGGTVHGFFLDPRSTGQIILWPATMLALGVAASSAWVIGAKIQFPDTIARLVVTLAALAFATYCLAVSLVSQAFWVAIIHYLPATAFLLIVLARTYQRTGERPAAIGVLGLLLTFVGSGIQQARIALHPVYFNHNALYHAIQAIALFMVFRCARWLVSRR